MSVKQVIVLRTDLNMRKGKMCAQAAHASMKVLLDRGESVISFSEDLKSSGEAFTFSMDANIKEWVEGLFTKITVGIDSEEGLLSLWNAALTANLPCAIIRDAGNTEFHGVPTFTALAIGPAQSSDIDLITGGLKLL